MGCGKKGRELDLMKSNFLSVTSHEMRTPLTLLRGYVEALLAGYFGDVSAPQRDALTICLQAADRLSERFADIEETLRLRLDRRLERRSLEMGALLRAVTDEFRPLAERRRQRLDLDAPSRPITLRGDATRLRLVFANLIENAIKFTPDAGAITLRLCPGPSAVLVSVADTGIGIQPDDAARIFDPFYTTRDALHHRSGDFEFLARGSGLGLAIVRGEAERHGGKAWVESRGPGQGSTFHVRLPRRAGAPESRAGRAPRRRSGEIARTPGNFETMGVS